MTSESIFSISNFYITVFFGSLGYYHENEEVQRAFTRQITGFGELTYKQRLDKLDLTTQLERRARGDLIETYKIFTGKTNYGQDMFRTSRYVKRIFFPTGKRIARQNDFLNSRVINYWNKLPTDVKSADTVDCFKRRLQAHKIGCLASSENSELNYWKLSTTLLNKINDSTRDQHIEFLRDNPRMAIFKKTNLGQVPIA